MGQPNPWTTLAHGSAGGLMNRSLRLLAAIVSEQNRRKCAETIGTVLVPWAGHFPL